MQVKTWAVVAASLLFVCAISIAQAPKASTAKESNDPNERVWMDAEVANMNLSNCIILHAANQDSMSGTQQPEDKVELPPPVTTADGTLVWDRPPGLHARSLMEQIRQELHKLTSVSEPRGMDPLAIDQARAVWPKLRDIYCHSTPKVGYYDLDGAQRYCPDK